MQTALQKINLTYCFLKNGKQRKIDSNAPAFRRNHRVNDKICACSLWFEGGGSEVVLLHFAMEVGDVQASHSGSASDVALGCPQTFRKIVDLKLLNDTFFSQFECREMIGCRQCCTLNTAG